MSAREQPCPAVISLTSGFCDSWRLQVTHTFFRLLLQRKKCLTLCLSAPKAQPLGEGQHQAVSTLWDSLGHLPWEPATCSLPSLNTQTGKWAELRLPSTARHPQYTTKHQYWQCLSSSRDAKSAALHITCRFYTPVWGWHQLCAL